MYFFMRSFKYLRKKLGKTILLAIIFLAIANFALAGLLIQQASLNTQEQTRLSIGSEITYDINMEAFFDQVEQGLIDREEMDSFRKGSAIYTSEIMTNKGAPTYANLVSAVDSDYVDNYYFSIEQTVASDLLQYGSETAGNFNLVFYDGELPANIADGNALLVDGALISGKEQTSGAGVVMIESSLADLNQLELGDQIEIDFTSSDGEVITLSQEIVGIYESSEEVDQITAQNSNYSKYPQNEIYIPFNYLTQVGYEDSLQDVLISQTSIELKDPEFIDAYKAEVEGKIDLDYGNLDANDALYESLVGPIELVGSISNIAVAIILITGAIIIGLITALTINERKNEIGILLAVGESKFKIVSQFVVEVLVIAVITFSLSIFTGEMIGNQVSQSALSSDLVQSSTTTEVARPGGGGGPGRSRDTEELQEEIGDVDMDISLSGDLIALVFAIGILLTILSTIIPALYVMRFNPKQILTNRDA